MLLPNAWFSKIGLLAAGTLLWGGGAAQEIVGSLKSLSEEDSNQCAHLDYFPCLVQYYALPTDLSGELVQTDLSRKNIPLSDEPRSSGLSPRLEKVAPILAIEKLGGLVQIELNQLRYVPTGNSEIDDKKKKEVAQRWAAFEFMLKRLDSARVGNETVFGYAQEDVSLKSTFRDLDELYAADCRDAGGAGLGLGWIFVYHQFPRRKPPRRSQKGDPDGDRGGGAGWRVVCDCEHDCESGVLIFG